MYRRLERGRMHYQRLCQCALVGVQQQGIWIALTQDLGSGQANSCRRYSWSLSSEARAQRWQLVRCLEGGVHCVAQELNYDFVIIRRMADGVAIVAHREGISACPKDLVVVTCAEISVLGTVKFKRVGEPFRGDHALFMQG
eukprot:1154234-Pelagomonas_calceolata.AAC.3